MTLIIFHARGLTPCQHLRGSYWVLACCCLPCVLPVCLLVNLHECEANSIKILLPAGWLVVCMSIHTRDYYLTSWSFCLEVVAMWINRNISKNLYFFTVIDERWTKFQTPNGEEIPFTLFANYSSSKAEVPKPFFLVDHIQNFTGFGGSPAATFLLYSQNSSTNVKNRSNDGNIFLCSIY